MKLLISIAFRNLVRQKRRNLLLGTAIAFGTMILIVANSFSHGITDTLFNRIVRMTYGHVNISATENANFFRQIVHEGDRVKRLIRENNPEVTGLQEAIGMMARAIGNGKSDNVMLVGVSIHDTLSPEDQALYNDNFPMIAGRFEDLENPAIANPLLIAKEKAEYLNVKVGDVVRMRFQDLHGQNQAASFTVAGIFKPTNVFMAMPVFGEIRRVKTLLGYKPYEAGQLMINVRNPETEAAVVAGRLQKLLAPEMAVIACDLPGRNGVAPVLVAGYKSDTASLKLCRAALPLAAGSPDSAFSRNGAVISGETARRTGLAVGDTCTARYASRYETDSGRIRFVVRGIREAGKLDSAVVLVNERDFFKAFYDNLPSRPAPEMLKRLPDSAFAAFAAIPGEWTLLRRIESSQDMMKLYKEIGRNKWKSTMVSVSTMYEGASAIIKLEYALNLITFACVMVLFFIILIGVVNTLRMTVRERTREIGTVRAIGMQKADVRNSFIAETVLLSVIASAAGTALAFLAMKLMGLPVIDSGDNPMGMLLVNGHLNFTPAAPAVAGYNLLIWAITALTAYFPARRAANMHAVEALRHYE